VGKVHNINLVTPEHVVPQVVLSILHARERDLNLPFVYNTSSFDSLESLELLDGLVDIYLADFKVWKEATAKRLLKAEGYATAAMKSTRKMHEQVGDLCFTSDGIAKRGLLLRHLVMPGKEDEGQVIMRWLGENVFKDVFVNIIEQYRPDAHVGKPSKARAFSVPERVTKPGGSSASLDTVTSVRYADINRPIYDGGVSSVRKAALDAGIWRFCDPPRHGGFSM